MALSLRTQKFVYIGIIIAIILAAIYFGYVQYQSVAVQWSKYQVTQAETAALRQEISDLQKLDAEMKQSSKEIGSLKQALPEGFALPDLLTNLEAIATRSGLGFNSVVTGAAKAVAARTGENKEAAAPTGVQQLALTVGVTGDYNGLKIYLDGIERNLRLIDIQSIAMSAPGEYQISMIAYYIE